MKSTFKLTLPFEFNITHQDLNLAGNAVERAIRRKLGLDDRVGDVIVYVDESRIAFDLHRKDSPNHYIIPLSYELQWWVVGYQRCQRMYPLRVSVTKNFATIVEHQSTRSRNERQKESITH